MRPLYVRGMFLCDLIAFDRELRLGGHICVDIIHIGGLIFLRYTLFCKIMHNYNYNNYIHVHRKW